MSSDTIDREDNSSGELKIDQLFELPINSRVASSSSIVFPVSTDSNYNELQGKVTLVTAFSNFVTKLSVCGLFCKISRSNCDKSSRKL